MGLTYPIGLLAPKASNNLILTINTALGTGASIDLRTFLPDGYTYNFNVDFGDGNNYNYSGTTPSTDSNLNHSYSGDNTYTLTFSKNTLSTPKVGGFAINNGTEKLKFTSVVQWGEVAFDNFNAAFYGCQNLTSVANGEIPLTTSVTTAGFCFANTGFTVGYSDWFKRGTNITSFASSFYLSKLLVIPTDIFRYNTSVDTFAGTFLQSDITTAPTDLFRYNTSVTSFSQTFQQSDIANIPTDLFRYNTSVTSFNSVFYDCQGLNSYIIPEDLFYYNSAVTNYNRSLLFIRNLTLPTRMFNLSNLSIVTTFFEFMRVGTTSWSATGTIQDIWNYATSATSTNCFLNQTSITNYASIPNGWKGL